MNKKIVLTVCLVVMGVLGVKAQDNGMGIVALHHNGKVTTYLGSKIQEAVNASAKGDTLYLSEGAFGGFNMPHSLVVLGSGENTILTSGIFLVGNEESKDMSGCVFSGLNMPAFGINESGITIDGLYLSQCQISEFGVSAETSIENAKMVMCYIKTRMRLDASIKSMEVDHSKIYAIAKGGAIEGAVNFHYCNININEESWNNGNRNFFFNSIVGTPRGGICFNCIYTMKDTNNAPYNSWREEWGSWGNGTDLSSPFSDEELISKGYLSTDGTVVGITGGRTPYTLELSAPHVIDHSWDIDNVNKTLKVTLKMNE